MDQYIKLFPQTFRTPENRIFSSLYQNCKYCWFEQTVWRNYCVFIGCHGSADDDIDSTYPTNVVVTSDGHCLWVPPGMYFSTCKIDITWFPFDEQMCGMKFGSWTYDSSGIDLQLHGEGGDLSTFIENGEWELLGRSSTQSIDGVLVAYFRLQRYMIMHN